MELRRRFWYGALTGALLTCAYVSVSYFGWRFANLPFVPFDLFDWLVRELPGDVVTLAIDSILALGVVFQVAAISSAAKAAEQILAIVVTIGLGSLAGGALLAVLGASGEPARLFGALAGALIGGLALIVLRSLQRLTPSALVVGIWTVGTALLFGLVFGWLCDQMNRFLNEPLGQPSRLVRRRFLLQVALASLAPSMLAALGARFDARRSRRVGTRWSDAHHLPNESAAVTPVRGTRPELTPLEAHYRIDATTRVPSIDAERWRLECSGLVERPIALTFESLQREPPVHQFVTLSCISNPVGGELIGTTRWTGVSLSHLLERIGPLPSATHLEFRSADGFFEVVSLDAIRQDARIMLAYAWDGVPLLPEHGFPARLYVPDVYGMKQPKWVVAVNAIDRWRPGYWVTRGWDPRGQVKTVSVIDAVRPRRPTGAGDRSSVIEVGGIAYAGARGVSRVEVRVDAGPWVPAQLRDPLSRTSWIVWRGELAVDRGDHRIAVRCDEADGTPQSTGFHTRPFTL